MGGTLSFEELFIVLAMIANKLECVKGFIGIFESNLMFFGLRTNC